MKGARQFISPKKAKVTVESATGMADNLAKMSCVNMLRWIREQGYEWSLSTPMGEGMWFPGGGPTIEYLTDEEMYNRFEKYLESCEQEKSS